MSEPASELRRMVAEATEGPWAIGFTDGSGAGEDGDGIYIRAEEQELAQNKTVVAGGADDWGSPNGVLRDEDARLIAKAPDLATLAADAIEDYDRLASGIHVTEQHGGPFEECNWHSCSTYRHLLSRATALTAQEPAS